MTPRIAIIGSGIAGMASAYYLRKAYDLTLIEKAHYVGGHTNTISLSREGKKLPIDTGFMVFNETTYPNLIRLFKELQVSSYDTSMSFGVANRDTGLEYACSGFNTFFAQRHQLLSPRHWQLYRDILRFFRAADQLIENPPEPNLTMADFARRFQLSEAVMRNFVVPMAAAIWSTPPQGILAFPALPLLRFMKNHRMLGVGIQLQWKTVEGGSQQYKEKLLAALPNPPRVSQDIQAVGQDERHAYLIDPQGNKQSYDYVILATHADQALRLLETPTATQRDLLSKFKYNRNAVALHSDPSVMPRQRRAWASWNVRHQSGSDGQCNSSTHYWMNSLQRIDSPENYFVSVDYHGSIDPSKIHWNTVYEHPLFDEAAIRAQPRLATLNADSRLLFCGSYFRNGFHEDALWSALGVAQKLLELRTHRHELAPL